MHTTVDTQRLSRRYFGSAFHVWTPLSTRGSHTVQSASNYPMINSSHWTSDLQLIQETVFGLICYQAEEKSPSTPLNSNVFCPGVIFNDIKIKQCLPLHLKLQHRTSLHPTSLSTNGFPVFEAPLSKIQTDPSAGSLSSTPPPSSHANFLLAKKL